MRCAYIKILFTACVCVLTVFCDTAAEAQDLYLTGVAAFRAVTTNLDGSGVRVAQIEASETGGATNFEPNPILVGMPTNRFLFVSDLGSDTNFPNSVGGYSVHATTVANAFYGSIHEGTATNLDHIDNYFEGYFDRLGFGLSFTVTLPAFNLNDPVANASFAYTGTTVSEQQTFDSAYDNYAAQYGTLFVCGLGNDGLADPPATCYNGLAVAAIAYNGQAGISSIGPTLDNGRCKPDLTAPAFFTSFSTPQVSGAAVLLIQAGLRGDGGMNTNFATDMRMLKALLLNGAVKPPGWTNANRSPLDARYGAGIVNVMNSYGQLIGGQHPSTASNSVPLNGAHPPTGAPGTVAALSGWDFATNTSSATTDAIRHYYFDVTNTVATARFAATATLVWNRHLNKTSINNLNLYLYNSANSNLVLCSTSQVDNVEHIYTTNLAQGHYDLQVWKAGGTTVTTNEAYALAWEFVPPPVLGIASGANPVLTWPVYPAGFLVEGRTNLLAGAWSTNLPAGTVTNGQNSIRLNMTNAVQFFRLRKPNL